MDHRRRIASAALASTLAAACAASPQPAPSREEGFAFQALADRQKWMFESVTPESANLDANTAQPASMAGREDLRAPPRPTQPRCIPLPGDPVRRIAEAARRTNIVIINEDHAQPRHRVFIGGVLKTLRAEGYSIYAAETFDNTTRPKSDHAGVMAADGYYLNEPTFSRTVALAKSLGYRLVAYEEDPSKNGPDVQDQGHGAGRDRQSDGGDLPRPSGRKGGDPCRLRPCDGSADPGRDGPKAWMAARLKAATGHDPLTISQTQCLSPNADIVAATDLTGLTGPATRRPVDLFIGYPTTSFAHGRPDWRRASGDVETPVPSPFLGRKETVIIEARPVGASLGIVPTDRILERPGDALPLLLPPRRSRIDAFTAAGRIAGDPVIVTVRRPGSPG